MKRAALLLAGALVSLSLEPPKAELEYFPYEFWVGNE